VITLQCLRPLVVAAALALASCSRVGDPVTYATRSVELRVDGMTCAGCENTICSSVKAVEGVQSCAADHVAGRVTIVYAPAKTSEQQLADTIRAAGYQVP
jgi:copper chaperone CopZ